MPRLPRGIIIAERTGSYNLAPSPVLSSMLRSPRLPQHRPLLVHHQAESCLLDQSLGASLGSAFIVGIFSMLAVLLSQQLHSTSASPSLARSRKRACVK